MSKLSERDVCSKFITPALVSAGWDLHTQIREEVSFTKGRIIVRGKLHTRGKGKRADYVLYFRPNQPIALIEAKDKNHSLGAGMQQALDYAETLDIPFVFSSNGDGLAKRFSTRPAALVAFSLAPSKPCAKTMCRRSSRSSYCKPPSSASKKSHYRTFYVRRT